MRSSQYFIYIILFLFIVILISCNKDSLVIKGTNSVLKIPEGFPSIIYPEGNEYTQERWLLGKKLFYDPRMSVSNSKSCSSCHLAQYAFSDTTALSLGDMNQLGRSNAPSLANVAYHPYYTRAGGVPTLEMQVLVPVQEHDEFNTNLLDIVDKLKLDSAYSKLAQVAYNRELDAYVITRAISNFERSFISGNSAYDRYTYQGINNSLTQSELRGKELFMSTKTNCSKCHNGFNFTNYSFENNGLYTIYADSGLMKLTLLESDRARFKVPSLRDIEFTAPYMHDGSIKTLEEVVAHYNSGGKAHENKSEFVKPLFLTAQEQTDLVTFLKSLSDYSFINNPKFKK